MDQILPMSERVPVDETIQALEYIKYEKEKDTVRQYFEDVMPFSESTSIKYRRRLFERYLFLEEGHVVYTPFLEMLSEIDSYQTKKEILFYMTVVKTVTLQIVLKDMYTGSLNKSFTKTELMDYLKQRMTEHKTSSIEKTLSVLTTVLRDFNIISVKENPMKKDTIFIVNERFRPTNETIAFSLYYEFFEIQDNRIPNTERLYNAETFNYFLINRFLADRYIKWLVTNNYLEFFKMGSNEQYQFTCSSLHDFVKRVLRNVES
ncbi:hypothetical protein [Virgibacillus sp. LDC-1]|uniref:hypothetical protein n=1 Tax=Virgibacillus sp. LDC-1 TaxID=3039856 RepID=UPI0024DDFF56|nr:hypothetical protein [Virgibacillus sp. LDC-1]